MRSREAHNAYYRAYLKRCRDSRRELLLQMAGGKCLRCGFNEGLEFDHRDPDSKLFTLSRENLSRSWEAILNEFAKCDLLCRPCHRDKTVEEGRSGGGHNKIQNPQHGTAYMYYTLSCRCRDCAYARSMYKRKIIESLHEVVKAPEFWKLGMRLSTVLKHMGV